MSYLIKFGLVVLSSVVVVMILMAVVDFSGFKAALLNADSKLLLLAALKGPVIITLWTIRWKGILKAKGHRIGLWNTYLAILIGSFVNNITPGFRTGGEPARAYIISKKEKISFSDSLASIVAERLLEGLTLIIVGIVSFCIVLLAVDIPATAAKLIFLMITIVFSIILLAFYLITFKFSRFQKLAIGLMALLSRLFSRVKSSNIEEKLSIFHHSYMLFIKNRKAISIVLVLSMVYWVLEILQPYIIFRALGEQVSIAVVMLNYVVVKFAGIVMVLPGGAGIAESSNFGLYILTTPLSKEIIAAETIIHRALDAWIIWILGAFTASSLGFSGAMKFLEMRKNERKSIS
jgi:uncharacterized protein (TIRG00374 family)